VRVAECARHDVFRELRGFVGRALRRKLEQLAIDQAAAQVKRGEVRDWDEVKAEFRAKYLKK